MERSIYVFIFYYCFHFIFVNLMLLLKSELGKRAENMLNKPDTMNQPKTLLSRVPPYTTVLWTNLSWVTTQDLKQIHLFLLFVSLRIDLVVLSTRRCST